MKRVPHSSTNLYFHGITRTKWNSPTINCHTVHLRTSNAELRTNSSIFPITSVRSSFFIHFIGSNISILTSSQKSAWISKNYLDLERGSLLTYKAGQLVRSSEPRNGTRFRFESQVRQRTVPFPPARDRE